MKKIIFLLLSALFFCSCNTGEIITNQNPVVGTSGVYLLSEGSMAPGSAKLSYYNSTNDSLYQNIFRPGNFGLFPDGMIFYGADIYVTEQGNYNSTGRLYKLDTSGNVLNSVLVGINPYSLCVSNGKLYITNGPAGNVSVLNASTLGFIKNISAGVYPQEIIALNGRVFVCNTSIYGGNQDSTISVIDALKDSVIKVIALGKDPFSIAVSKDNNIIAGCLGADGKLYEIDPAAFVILDTLSNQWGFGKDISVDMQTNDIYFISNSNHIVKSNFASRTSVIAVNNSEPAGSFFYGYLFDSVNRRHYIADARNFSVSGLLKIYDINSALINSFSTGIAPRRLMLR
ncbi:MAG: hypothetical protein NTV87_06750 [Ignavibacteriae bacterium]|nr:hypothetical protein [Ignavibacteriota bacterium]